MPDSGRNTWGKSYDGGARWPASAGTNEDTQPSSVSRAVDEYVSRSLPREAVGRVRPFAKVVVHQFAPVSDEGAKNAMRDVCGLAAWCLKVGLPLEIEVVFDPDTIERYVAEGLHHVAAQTRRTYRGDLVRIARSVAPQLQPPARASEPREGAKAPYSAREVKEFMRLAEHQPTLRWGRRLSAFLCLGLGAGLQPGEHRDARPGDVSQRDGVVYITVHGLHPRTIPMLEPFGSRLLELSAVTDEDYLVGGSSGSQRHVVINRMLAATKGGADLPRIDSGRLRATWLIHHVTHLGVDALLAAAGVVVTHVLTDLARELVPPDLERMTRVLRGSL